MILPPTPRATFIKTFIGTPSRVTGDAATSPGTIAGRPQTAKHAQHCARQTSAPQQRALAHFQRETQLPHGLLFRRLEPGGSGRGNGMSLRRKCNSQCIPLSALLQVRDKSPHQEQAYPKGASPGWRTLLTPLRVKILISNSI